MDWSAGSLLLPPPLASDCLPSPCFSNCISAFLICISVFLYFCIFFQIPVSSSPLVCQSVYSHFAFQTVFLLFSVFVFLYFCISIFVHKLYFYFSFFFRSPPLLFTRNQKQLFAERFSLWRSPWGESVFSSITITN